MGSRIFISYPSDEKVVAERICATIEVEDLSCWIAPRDIPPGADWAESIMSGIGDCELLLVVISENTGGSPHVLREIERAVNQRLELLAVRIDGTIPDGNLGYFLGTSQWFEAPKGKLAGKEEPLREAVREALERHDRSTGNSSLTAPARKHPVRIAVAAVALVALVAIAWTLLGAGDDPSGGSAESLRLSQDATELVSEISVHTQDLKRTIDSTRPTEPLAAGFAQSGEEAASIAADANSKLVADAPGRNGLIQTGQDLEKVSEELGSIADTTAVPGLEEARAARGAFVESLDSLEAALKELNDSLEAEGADQVAKSVDQTVRQLRANRDALVAPYTQLIRSL